MVTIPIQDAPDFIETVTLDGKPYTFRFRFNYRQQYWSLEIATPAGEILLAGVKLVCNWELIGMYPGRGLPPGYLAVIDPTSETGHPVNRETLGKEVQLIYMTEAERAAL